MATSVVPRPVPPPSMYLGDSLYVDFSQAHGLVRIWASTGSEHSHPLYLSPEVIGGILNYAARCYAPVTGANDEYGPESVEN
jgi:hypothetical protein